MINLKQIEIEGFRSFKQRTVIDFPDNGLVLLNGKYENSDISSGSGKSSILMAIAYALDICDLPATELKNWDSNRLFVKLTLKKNEDLIEIVRNPKLSLIINGVEYESLITGAKEKLKELLNTSTELLSSLIYRPQRSSGKFINLTDSAIKDFLTEVLNLNQIEKALNDFEKELFEAEADLYKSELQESNFRNFIESNTLSPEELERAKKDYNDCVLKINAAQSSEKTAEIENQIKIYSNRLAEYNEVLSKNNQAVFENKTIRSQIVSLNNEIEKLKEELCPTCNREWNSAEELLENKKTKLKELIQKMQVNINFQKNAEPIIENIETVRSKISELQISLGEAKAPVKNAMIAKSMAEKTLTSLTTIFESIETTKKALKCAEEKTQKIKKQVEIKKNQIILLGRNGFLGVIFDEILKEIEVRSNDMIRHIPNISEISISLSSVTVNKNGNTKNSISKKVFKTGKETSVKSLSGGQQCSLELCVDLAVAETIRSRHGSQLNWIALDEAMDGLGVTEKQAALDMIKTKVNGLVLIIDHATEIKEAFEKIININYNGRESYVIDNS